MDSQYIDLLITQRDFTLNSGKEPILCNNRVSIAQDCVHAIMESGLATQLVGERSPTLLADIRNQIEMLVENDERIVPGTISIQEESPVKLWITAETYDFGRMDVGVDYGD
ncbi:TPA: DUF2590 family protein [Providencia stuartii]|uniref:DUF2590 family protein n=1 Tax=Providencia stuartii TaxID=588 RepID=UPI000909D251|nr:DUF2590 family protein [Providencia stuartii]APG52497.1 hypothetical protein BGK56_16730 [Providencia stuartii]AVL41266.1 DUF2590 domain-containing protein [Providencia stuartii]MBG5904564.1 DUF2590 family protein [Providencia stuartii]MBG5912161.1 DUF2590 family protein [Providencia stuartii]MBG5916157.1 DUF2590 family protein [Providencia stuartii]